MSRRRAYFAAFPVLAQDSQGPQEVVSFSSPSAQPHRVHKAAFNKLAKLPIEFIELRFRPIGLHLQIDKPGHDGTSILQKSPRMLMRPFSGRNPV